MGICIYMYACTCDMMYDLKYEQMSRKPYALMALAFFN